MLIFATRDHTGRKNLWHSTTATGLASARREVEEYWQLLEPTNPPKVHTLLYLVNNHAPTTQAPT